MTTSLIAGLSYDKAVAAVVDAAQRCLTPGISLGLWTETGNDKVLVGIARPDHPALVIEIERAEYDGMLLLQTLGVDMTPTRINSHVAAERARKARK